MPLEHLLSNILLESVIQILFSTSVRVIQWEVTQIWGEANAINPLQPWDKLQMFSWSGADLRIYIIEATNEKQTMFVTISEFVYFKCVAANIRIMTGSFFSCVVNSGFESRHLWLTANIFRSLTYMLLKPASNDFECICEQSWKDQCSMEVYNTIIRTKSYCSKLLTKLVITTKNFFYIRYAT